MHFSEYRELVENTSLQFYSTLYIFHFLFRTWCARGISKTLVIFFLEILNIEKKYIFVLTILLQGSHGIPQNMSATLYLYMYDYHKDEM